MLSLQFSFGKKSTPSGGSGISGSSTSSNSSADEKLRKAIERNRRKMAQRQPSGASPSSRSEPSSSIAQRLRQSAVTPSQRQNSSSSGGSILERMRSRREASKEAPTPNRSQMSQQMPPPRPSMQSMQEASSRQAMASQREVGQRELPRRSVSQASAMRESQSQSLRRPVTSVDSIEMNAPVKKDINTSASVSYDTRSIQKSGTKRRKTSSKKKSFELASWVVKGGWLFCAFLVLRLIFSEGGLLEYHDKTTEYKSDIQELERLKVENENLMVELKKMNDDSIYQKKLVRDHLGYIARNEYLVLFSN